MPLSAGETRVREIVQEFADTGALACGQCVSSADPEVKVCQALTDSVTPGVIDPGEAEYVLHTDDDFAT